MVITNYEFDNQQNNLPPGNDIGKYIFIFVLSISKQCKHKKRNSAKNEIILFKGFTVAYYLIIMFMMTIVFKMLQPIKNVIE